ncbi:hypothetical protein GIB67_039580 [Kingdonia uniflora]|uniref:Uncharacterized protein n=1 Tax=Kingdonia uniflora TaxID=39325 RepID=A0A7J7P6X8_9MAGN|nr:hypothetical protein GIB67_039580 [Kingdonia uniflora]
MEDNLFLGLPPPSSIPPSLPPVEDQRSQITIKNESLPTVPPPFLKSALKRSKPLEEQTQLAGASTQKRARFKTIEDASERQVIDAMQKIASHINHPTKFKKASKLAMQLIEAGSVKPETSDLFFAILEAAMSSATSCSDPSIRGDYHALFSAAQDIADCFSKKQKNQLAIWSIRAVVANDLFTDDSFVFSKAAGRVKEMISSLPVATKDDDVDETEALKEEKENADEQAKNVSEEAELDPFGLDALLTGTSKKDERAKGKKEKKAEEEDSRNFLKLRRDALVFCLETAARRYRVTWCQTGIDILVKHASDNIERFTSQQRDAIQKLSTSIREQQFRRKQGKSTTGKLDMNDFEQYQQKYAGEKISIRRGVGGGERRAQQWLG